MARLEEDQRAIITAMYANGNLGGDDLTKAIEDVGATFDEQRAILLGGKALVADEEFVTHEWWKPQEE